MKIAAYHETVTLQKSEAITDAIGNHSLVWQDYYTAHAKVEDKSGGEQMDVGITTAQCSIEVTLRHCKALGQVTSTGYRLVFRGAPYNIRSIDHLGYRNIQIKFKCEKEGD